MSEGYNYQVVVGIVKVIRPQGRQVLGIADGQGNFLWLPEAEIIVAHPNQYVNWQTTMFAIKSTYNINWKPEKNWEQYKDSYPSNTKPIIQPIPQMFTMQHPIPAQAPAPLPQPTLTAPVTSMQQVVQPAIPQIPQSNANPYDLGLNDFLFRIANELEGIRKLLEMYIKPPHFKTADTLSEEELIEQYGVPPNNVDNNAQNNQVNKDRLPSIF